LTLTRPGFRGTKAKKYKPIILKYQSEEVSEKYKNGYFKTVVESDSGRRLQISAQVVQEAFVVRREDSGRPNDRQLWHTDSINIEKKWLDDEP
jgi:hypothetical protein